MNVFLKKVAPVCLALMALATPALAEDKSNAGKWLVRGRLVDVIPDESSTISPVGGKASINSQVIPEVDFTYFFTNNIAAELILGTSRHSVTAKGTSVGDVNVGSLWVLPPTLTLQYHFTQFDRVKPYVGAGVNYTMYYNENGGALGHLETEDSLGWALQAGVDIAMTDRWAWNFDVKKIFVNADSKWTTAGISAKVDLDPWVVGTGVTYKLN